MKFVRRPARISRRGAGVALALALIASGCAGASTTDTVEAANPTSIAPVPTTAPLDQPTADAPATTADAPEPTTVPPATAPEPTVEAPALAAVQLPDTEVVNLATGQTANLATFARPGPTLVWFWAPH